MIILKILFLYCLFCWLVSAYQVFTTTDKFIEFCKNDDPLTYDMMHAHMGNLGMAIVFGISLSIAILIAPIEALFYFWDKILCIYQYSRYWYKSKKLKKKLIKKEHEALLKATLKLDQVMWHEAKTRFLQSPFADPK